MRAVSAVLQGGRRVPAASGIVPRRNGPARVSGQAALRPPRHPGPVRQARLHRRRRRRRRRRDRLPLRRQGAGADRRPRQGRRHQARQGQSGGDASTPPRSSGWTSRASRSTRCGSRAPPTSPRSTTRRSSSTAPRRRPLVMLSTQGGMDIEEVAEKTPDALARLHVDPLLGFQDFHGRQLAFEAGVAAGPDPPGRRDAREALRRPSSPRRRCWSRSTR